MQISSSISVVVMANKFDWTEIWGSLMKNRDLHAELPCSGSHTALDLIPDLIQISIPSCPQLPARPGNNNWPLPYKTKHPQLSGPTIAIVNSFPLFAVQPFSQNSNTGYFALEIKFCANLKKIFSFTRGFAVLHSDKICQMTKCTWTVFPNLL